MVSRGMGYSDWPSLGQVRAGLALEKADGDTCWADIQLLLSLLGVIIRVGVIWGHHPHY